MWLHYRNHERACYTVQVGERYCYDTRAGDPLFDTELPELPDDPAMNDEIFEILRANRQAIQTSRTGTHTMMA